MLSIIVPVIEEEYNHFLQRLPRLQENLFKSGINSYEILVILQTKNEIYTLNSEFVTTKVTPYYSVSHARNIGLDIASSNCEYVYFLDQDALPSAQFLRQCKVNMGKGLDIWSGRICWVDGAIQDTIKPKLIMVEDRSVFFIPFNSFVGCYVFRKSLIMTGSGLLNFNECLGPAEDTVLKTGEDVLFLCEMFAFNGIKKCKFYPNLAVYHPRRPKNNLKNLMYSEGQAATYKYIFLTKFFGFKVRLSALIYLFLFMCNALKRFLFFEDSGLAIFNVRFRAILKRHDIFNKHQ